MSDGIDRSMFINRELSWLGFNWRCLEEAMSPDVPLLERVKFLAICYGNMDEFFMIRMPGLLGADIDRLVNIGPDAFEDDNALIREINSQVNRLTDGYETAWAEIEKGLDKKDIRILSPDSLSERQKMWVDDFYTERIHPLLTPLALDVSHPFPFISNNSLNLAVRLRDESDTVLYARVKVPVGVLPRFIRIPSEGKKNDYMLLENIIKTHVSALFPLLEVLGVYKFRITRNADVKVTIDEAADLMAAVESAMDSRDQGFPVRMVVEDTMPSDIVALFSRNLKLKENQVTRASDKGMMLTDLWELYNLNRPALKYPPLAPGLPTAVIEAPTMFSLIRKKDWIFYHPYEPFDVVIRFLREAADDPDVKSVKICLYRLGKNSEIIRQLMRAKERGKNVSVLMELRAKFDEVNNIALARELENIGVHVVYGPVNLKVHSKLLQVVRLEKDKLIRYTHMSSGNYNANTARTYADISFFTANQELGEDVGELFNALTGYFGPRNYKHLLVAPLTLKSTLIDLIKNETEHAKEGRKAYIAMKCNGLIDSDVITELYRASQAGVKVELNVRGLCCLRPGVKGVSDNITVTSIVDMLLEHARIYYFENGGYPRMYMGSSDLMPRNLIARVETLFPVLDPEMLVNIRENILNPCLHDNVKARELHSDGTYVLRKCAKGEKRMRSQEWYNENRGIWHGQDSRVH